MTRRRCSLIRFGNGVPFGSRKARQEKSCFVTLIISGTECGRDILGTIDLPDCSQLDMATFFKCSIFLSIRSFFRETFERSLWRSKILCAPNSVACAIARSMAPPLMRERPMAISFLSLSSKLKSASTLNFACLG